VQGCAVLGCVIFAFALGQPLNAQDVKAQSDRIAARIRSLQAESDRIAAQARTVFGDLRRLEIDREIKQQEVTKTELALTRVTTERNRTERQLKALEATRIAQTPGIKERLVELSKHGRAGYVQLLLSSSDVRAIGRMARGVAAVAEIDRVRLDVHRRTLAAERDALNELDRQHQEVDTLKKEATRARAAVDAAVAARNRLIDELDRRRDLAAQYVAELQTFQAELDRTVASAGSGAPVMALPIRPFRGDLPWPVAGRVVTRFGRQSAGRFGTSIVRNGIEVSAADGTAATAVHEGAVAYAAPFSGFGTLVIIDHGQSAFTLYGHLSETAVRPGMNVSRGAAIGRVGLGPSGGAALYFEVRIDGRPVDPLQWLARRNP
jgi:murein hydrolase activator